MSLNFEHARELMVKNQLRPNKIKEEVILNLFKTTPKENFVPEDDEELPFEEGDFIAIYEWNDPEWWKGENLTTKAVGMFPSNLVLTDEEFKERELLRKEEERKEEERQMELMADIAMEGIAVLDDEDGERALRVVFNLLDFIIIKHK